MNVLPDLPDKCVGCLRNVGQAYWVSMFFVYGTPAKMMIVCNSCWNGGYKVRQHAKADKEEHGR